MRTLTATRITNVILQRAPSLVLWVPKLSDIIASLKVAAGVADSNRLPVALQLVLLELKCLAEFEAGAELENEIEAGREGQEATAETRTILNVLVAARIDAARVPGLGRAPNRSRASSLLDWPVLRRSVRSPGTL